ncbi:MAG: hypothetical protein ABW022_07080 [Actinoplanes sp.]
MDENDMARTDSAGSFKYRSAAAIRDDDRLLVCFRVTAVVATTPECPDGDEAVAA